MAEIIDGKAVAKKIRKELKYPPYYYMVSIKIVSNNYEMARDESNKVKK